jgi:hypothetical protein
MLLSLPRELRDMITEYVLLTPHESPAALPTGEKSSDPCLLPSNAPWTASPYPYFMSIPPFHCPMRNTDKQLREEVQDRASNIEIPLVLDLLVFPDLTFQCTWLSQPSGDVASWKRIPRMFIGLRYPPIKVRWDPLALQRAVNSNDEAAMQRCWERMVGGNLARHALCVIRAAILSVLYPQENRSVENIWTAALSERSAMNVIECVDIEISVVESDARTSTADEKWFVPAANLPHCVETMCRESEFWLLYDSLICIQEKEALLSLKGRPLMTHVGSIKIRVAGGDDPVGIELGATRSLHPFELYMEGSLRDVKDMRRLIGWDDGKMEDGELERALEEEA